MGFFSDVTGYAKKYLNPVEMANPGWGLGRGFGEWAQDNRPGWFGPNDGSDEMADAMREYNAMMKEEYEQNRLMQREFAQKGLGWMLDDAKSRGLSPLAAIGGRAPQYSPMSSGRRPVIPGQKASKYSNMMNILQMALGFAQVRNLMSATALNKAKADFMSQGQNAGGMDQGYVYGPGSPGNVVVDPVITKARSSKQSFQAGVIPSYAYRENHYGLRVVPSDEMNLRLMGNPARS